MAEIQLESEDLRWGRADLRDHADAQTAVEQHILAEMPRTAVLVARTGDLFEDPQTHEARMLPDARVHAEAAEGLHDGKMSKAVLSHAGVTSGAAHA